MTELQPLPVTPRMSRHAAERCAEMGIRTRRAKRIYQQWRVTYSGTTDTRGRRIAFSEDPDYAVVYGQALDGHPVIVTVVFRTDVDYDRDGATYTERTAP